MCSRAGAQAEDNRSQTIYRAGKSSIWDTRLHELEDMGIGVSLYFQFLKVFRALEGTRVDAMML